MRRIRYKCLEWRCVQQSKLENSYSLHNVPSTVLLRSLLNTSLTDEANVKEVDDSDFNEALMLYQNLVDNTATPEEASDAEAIQRI